MRETEAAQSITAARRAFLETGWRSDRVLRAKVLATMANRIEARTDDLIAILSLENGKIRKEARFKIEMVPAKLHFYAGRFALEEATDAVARLTRDFLARRLVSADPI